MHFLSRAECCPLIGQDKVGTWGFMCLVTRNTLDKLLTDRDDTLGNTIDNTLQWNSQDAQLCCQTQSVGVHEQ